MPDKASRKPTIDERLDRLTERHEALTQTVELMAAENRDRDKRLDGILTQMAEGIARTRLDSPRSPPIRNATLSTSTHWCVSRKSTSTACPAWRVIGREHAALASALEAYFQSRAAVSLA